MSGMSQGDFIEAMGALGLDGNAMAAAIGRTKTMVSRYRNGASPIPKDIADKISDLIKARREFLHRLHGKVYASSAAMMVASNETRMREPAGPHRTEGRFMRRQATPDTRVFPAYRFRDRRYLITYATALMAWRDRVVELSRKYTDEARQRDYRLEFRDIEVLKDTVPRHAPYEVYIERGQWGTVSRALVYLRDTNPEHRLAAQALHHHWNKHKGCGYPVNRNAVLANAQAASQPPSKVTQPVLPKVDNYDGLLEAMTAPEPSVVEEGEEEFLDENGNWTSEPPPPPAPAEEIEEFPDGPTEIQSLTNQVLGGLS